MKKKSSAFCGAESSGRRKVAHSDRGVRQAVILAAGKGIRFHPLTKTRPKPLLGSVNKTTLSHNLEQLNNLVKEVILVVGYQADMIKGLFGSQYKNLKIKYIVQTPQLGTGDAAKKASFLVREKFLLLNGDDIYEKKDIEKCLSRYPCILLAKSADFSNFGAVSLKGSSVKGIVEKPKKTINNLVNTGLYFLPKSIFDFKIKKSPRGEYEFTDYVKQFIEKTKLYFVVAKNWYPLSYPWNLFEATRFFLQKERAKNAGRVEKNCVLKGKIIIEKGASVKSGAYLEGPVLIGKNSQIGPNCYLRGPVSIGSDCFVGQAVEIKNSIIGNNSRISHLSFIGDSIIGENCNLGAGTVVANMRFDQKSIKVKVNGETIDTKLEKFGCIMGDNVKVGINVSIMPGIIVGQNAILSPSSLIKENVKDNYCFRKT